MWVTILLLAWAIALLTCARLCLAAVAAGRMPEPGAMVRDGSELSLYETAFLAGGPRRVTELTLVRMARARRVLLAHTGWVTVVDPAGRDAIERTVIEAIGPAGQAQIPEVHTAAAKAEPLAELGERLAEGGLAVPPVAREAVTSGIRQVSRATAAIVVLALAASTLRTVEGGPSGTWAWFALPLLLTTGCLIIARIEVHPYTRWASPAGQQLLARMGIPRQRRSPTPEHLAEEEEAALLTALAVRGPGVLPEPELRAALGRPRG